MASSLATRKPCARSPPERIPNPFDNRNRTRSRPFSPCAKNICSIVEAPPTRLPSREADGFLHVGRLVLAAWRPPALLVHLRHPGRRPAATASASSCQALQTHDCLLDLFTFLTQFRKDLANVHLAPREKSAACEWASLFRHQNKSTLLIACAVVFLTHFGQHFKLFVLNSEQN